MVASSVDSDAVLCSPIDCLTEGTTLTYCLVIPAKLNVDMLRAALFRAVETKIPRAGARLASNNGLYEFCVPRQFSDTVPAVHFTHVCHDAPFPSAKTNIPPPFPSAAQHIPFITDLPDGHMFRGPNTPLTMAEYLAPNTPMVSVHIAVYDTTTLIGMTAPHMAFDISGAKEFFAIWVASLDNALDSIVEAPRTYSPMVEIAANRQARGEDLTDTSPPREWGAFTVLGTLAYLIGAILRRLFEGPEETKMIYVPLEWLAERKSETLAELQTQSPSEWLGTNDILMAFVVKMVFAGRTDNAPARLLIPLNLRRVLPSAFKHTYLHNGLSTVTSACVPAKQLAQQSLLETSLVLRRDLNDFVANTDALELEMARLTHNFNGRRPLLLPSPANVEMVALSNWRSAELNKLDFSAARVDGGRGGGSAKPNFVFMKRWQGPTAFLRGMGAVCSEDEHGVWIYFTLGSRVWERIRRCAGIPFAG